jgi:hypothetical protein
LGGSTRKKFGKYTKTKHVWGKDIVTYYETPYFFEIDLLYPHQTKDINLFSEFIKNLINHPCIHEDRHIIVLQSIEQLSDNTRSTALRVLFERYSKNAFFICTTGYIGRLEQPIISRFFGIRCPIFTQDEMENCFKVLGRNYNRLLKESDCHDFYYALFISWLQEHYPEDINEAICYKFPYFYEFLLTTETSTPSLEDIRTITQKISINDGTFRMILEDLLRYYKNYSDEWKHDIVDKCSYVDKLCSTTEEYRKPLYIEYLFNIIFNNLQNYKELQRIPNKPDIITNTLVPSLQNIDLKSTTTKSTKTTKSTIKKTNKV